MTTLSSLIPGTFNSRDLGGLPALGGVVRGGTVVRSDAPVHLGEAGRAALQELGVRVAIDLREPIESDLDPADLGGLGIELHHLPILGAFHLQKGMSLDGMYKDLLETRGSHLTAAVRLLAAPNTLPALFFCSAGKDRTGLVTALLLGALGVPDDEIVLDYARTDRSLQGDVRARIVSRAVAAGISEQELAVALGAPAELMTATLGWLQERHVGAAGYLLENGLPRQELATLRQKLVEPGVDTVRPEPRVTSGDRRS